MDDDFNWTEATHNQLRMLSAAFQHRLELEFPNRGQQAFVALVLGTFAELVRLAEDPEILRTGLNEQLDDTQFRLMRVN